MCLKIIALLVELYIAGVLVRLVFMMARGTTPTSHGLRRPYRYEEYQLEPLGWPVDLFHWLVGRMRK